ncbi:MAG TPA: glycosyltransferase family A protein, partial [Candidatus Saccharimonadales bacterium]|nr:glycosyltransferase family A protein [Candidatus Saccharimonadales bacterium]
MASSDPEVSVIIPTYNESTYIHIILRNLAQQDFRHFEVIVSDAQSKDGIDKVIDKLSSKFQSIKLVESPPKGPGAGRNFGAKRAKGKWLLFLDADVRLHSNNFISVVLNNAKLNNWATASAKLTTKDANLAEKIGTRIDYSYIKLLSHTKHPVAP